MRETDVLSTKNVLCLIQAIPSPKAEPFKMWLAKVEIKNTWRNSQNDQNLLL